AASGRSRSHTAASALCAPRSRFIDPNAAPTLAPNSFQPKDSARRKTFQLVVYFVLAILILIALVSGLLLPLSIYSAGEPVSWWQPELLLLAAPGVGLVVGGASAFKVAQLASGGQAVALMMGGEEVPGTTTDARQERRLNDPE